MVRLPSKYPMLVGLYHFSEGLHLTLIIDPIYESLTSSFKLWVGLQLGSQYKLLPNLSL